MKTGESFFPPSPVNKSMDERTFRTPVPTCRWRIATCHNMRNYVASIQRSHLILLRGSNWLSNREKFQTLTTWRIVTWHNVASMLDGGSQHIANSHLQRASAVPLNSLVGF